MEQVLLGVAGASAANAGNLFERSTRAVLEPFAEVLHAVAHSFSSQENEIRDKAKSNEIPLANRIEESLTVAGINIKEPLELSVKGGKVAVESDHPQRALIEAALAQDPTLAADLSRLIEHNEGTSVLVGESTQPFADSQPRIAVFSNLAGEPRLELR